MSFRLNRRRFLTGTSTLFGSALMGRKVVAQDTPESPLTGPYDFSNPYDWLTAYAKVRGRLDGGVGLYHYIAHIYGVPDDGVAQLMFRREGVSQHRMTVREDRTVDLRYVECNYTQHPETGALIDEFYDNPLTGKLLPVQHQPPVSGPLVRVNPTGGFTPEMEWEEPSALVNTVTPPLFGKGRVFFNHDILLYRPGESQLTELITFSSDIRDIQNPELTSAKSFAIISANTPWPTWLDMGDLPGHLMMRYLAEKVETIEEIPSWLRLQIDKDHPNFFTEPGI